MYPSLPGDMSCCSLCQPLITHPLCWSPANFLLALHSYWLASSFSLSSFPFPFLSSTILDCRHLHFLVYTSFSEMHHVKSFFLLPTAFLLSVISLSALPGILEIRTKNKYVYKLFMLFKVFLVNNVSQELCFQGPAHLVSLGQELKLID